MELKVSRYKYLVFIALLPVFRPPLTWIGPTRIPASDLLFLLAAAFFAIAVVRGRARFVYDRAFAYLSLFAGALILATAFSEEPLRSSIKLSGNLYLIGAAVLYVQHAREPDFIRHSLYAWGVGLVVTLVAVAAGLGMFFLGYTDEISNYFMYHAGTLPTERLPRMMGLFANPNMLCTYLAASVPIVLAAGRTQMIPRSVLYLLLFGIAIASLLTISPGIGGVALGAGLWFVFADLRERPVMKAIVAAGTAAIAALFVLSAMVTTDTANSSADLRIPGTQIVVEPAVRVLIWQSSLNIVAEHPVAGRGTGLSTAHVPYQPLVGPKQLLLDAHNMWLSVWAQAGTIGFAAFLLLVIHLTCRCRFSAPVNADSAVLLGLSCAFVAAFLYQGLSGSFEDARHLWVMIGMLIAVSDVDVRNDPHLEATKA